MNTNTRFTKQPNGTVRYFDNNNRAHRDDGPAVIMRNGVLTYYQHGKLHREDGPAVINIPEMKMSWYQDGKLHREDGPAVLAANRSGLTQIAFFIEGKRHRRDGPAELETLQNQIVNVYYIDDNILRIGNKAIDYINMRYDKFTDEEEEFKKYFMEFRVKMKEARDVFKENFPGYSV